MLGKQLKGISWILISIVYGFSSFSRTVSPPSWVQSELLGSLRGGEGLGKASML